MKQNNRDLGTKLRNRLKALLDQAFNYGEYDQAKEYKKMIDLLEAMVQIVKDNPI